MKAGSVRAGLYVRISDDADGRGLGVARQEADCRQLCEQRGWQVADVYEDNDRSAYSGKPRPAYQRMLADMAGGRLDAVVVWDTDRLTRRTMELEQFMAVAETAKVDLAVVSGMVDLGSDGGRFVARVMGARAQMESDDKRRRLRRKHEELAAAGKVSGGGWRPFGFEDDRRTVREDEAVLIRQAAEHLLAGGSMRSLARRWEADGVRSPADKTWSATALRRMIGSPRAAGLREHHGEAVGPAEWPAILDEVTHRRLKTRLKGTGEARQNRERRYLLTGGLAVCGLCGTALVARPRNDGERCLVCAKGPGEPGCGRIRVLAQPLEDMVGVAVIEALDGPRLGQALRADRETDSQEAGLLDQIARWQAQLEQASADYYTAEPDSRLSLGEFQAARRALQGRIDQAKGRLGRNSRRRMLVSLPAGRQGLEQAWEQGDLGWRRALVAAIIDRIQINPATRGLNRFDPNRIDINWRA